MPLYRVHLKSGKDIQIEADGHTRLTYSDHEGGSPGDLLFRSGGHIVRRYTKDEWETYEEVSTSAGPLDSDPNYFGFGGNPPQS